MTEKTPTRLTETHKMFTKTLLKLSRHMRPSEVFADFIRLAADDIDLAATKSNAAQEFRDNVAQRYSNADLQMFPLLFKLLCEGLEESFHDFLGMSLMELDMGNNRMGQYFSPDCIGRLQSQILLSSGHAEIEKFGYMHVVEPTSGSGGLLIAMAHKLVQDGFNPSTQMLVSCSDLDPLAADMAFIQLSMLGIPAEVFTGNTLTRQFTRCRRTVIYYRNDFENQQQVRQMYENILPIMQ